MPNGANPIGGLDIMIEKAITEIWDALVITGEIQASCTLSAVMELPHDTHSHRRWRLDVGEMSFFVKACGWTGLYSQAMRYFSHGALPSFSDESIIYRRISAGPTQCILKPLAVIDRGHDRFMVLPWVFGNLLEKDAYGSEPWLSTARALAALSRCLTELGADWFCNSNPMLAHSSPESLVDKGAASAGRVSEKLAEAIRCNKAGFVESISHALKCPAGSVHGQLYANNVMIEHETGRPVILDWESYDVGPAYYDLASLCGGLGWSECGRRAIIEAFYSSLPPGEQPARTGFEELVRATEVYHQFRLLATLPVVFWRPPLVDNAVAILTARQGKRC
jgi:aminoglycoside phosphotransferase (APT) family kinase protein